MRKNIILIILLIILILSTSIIIILQHNSDNESSSILAPSWDNVYISIEDNTLTPSSVTLIIENNNIIPINNELFINPSYYFIDKKIENNWNTLSEHLYFVPGIYTMDYKHNTKKTLNWKGKYGKLEAGQYRLRFELENYNEISYATTKIIEFTI